MVFYALLPQKLAGHFSSYEGTGTVFGSINKTELENIQLAVPPDEVIAEFERLINPIDILIGDIEKQSAILVQTRDTLLPKLMNGEISVGECECACSDNLRSREWRIQDSPLRYTPPHQN